MYYSEGECGLAAIFAQTKNIDMVPPMDKTGLQAGEESVRPTLQWDGAPCVRVALEIAVLFVLGIQYSLVVEPSKRANDKKPRTPTPTPEEVFNMYCHKHNPPVWFDLKGNGCPECRRNKR